MAQQTWTITGQIRVKENESTGNWEYRNLAGIEVEVAGSTISSSTGWNEWGTVRTGKAGKFTLRVEKNKQGRYIRVRVRFRDDDLEIKGSKLNVLESNWNTVYKSTSKKDGPSIDIGTRTFAAGGAEDLGDEDYRRQAVAWYLCRTTIDTLVEKDPYFAFKKKVNVVYPAQVISATPYANGVDRTAYIHKDNADLWWSAETVLHEFMHLWNYDHNKGTADWLAAICFDFNTHGKQENANIAFHEGFAQYAAEELLHHIWGHEKKLPYNRKYLTDKGLRDLDMVERNDYGVISGLHLLTAPKSPGLYKFLFGTRTSRPDNLEYGSNYVGVSHGMVVCPSPPRLNFWDVLRAFEAHPAAGWDTEWQVGDKDYGLVRFFNRCSDIYPEFDRDTRDLMLDLLDTSLELEPRSNCAQTLDRQLNTPVLDRINPLRVGSLS